MAEEKDTELEAITAKRWKLAVVLTASMFLTYFGFIFLVAYAKPTLGALVAPGLSWGILLGALVIVVAWILTGIYVRWANGVYDATLAKIRGRK